jgi:Uma2 family endonuclease
MRDQDYPVYAPTLVIEVLPPSNRRREIIRKRLVAFSGGTQEFWIIDPNAKTIEVSTLGNPSRIYGLQDSIPVGPFPAVTLLVSAVFAS